MTQYIYNIIAKIAPQHKENKRTEKRLKFVYKKLQQ